MGNPKGLALFNGRPWLVEQWERCYLAGIREIILVLGFDHKKYEVVLKKVSVPAGLELTVVRNEQPEYGPFSSLICGYQNLKRPLNAAFFLPVDVPCPDKVVWEKLVGHFKIGIDAVIPSVLGHGGHPVLLAARFLAKLSRLPFASPDARLDRQIHSLARDRVGYVDVDDEKILVNINTPADFHSHYGTTSTG